MTKSRQKGGITGIEEAIVISLASKVVVYMLMKRVRRGLDNANDNSDYISLFQEDIDKINESLFKGCNLSQQIDLKYDFSSFKHLYSEDDSKEKFKEILTDIIEQVLSIGTGDIEGILDATDLFNNILKAICVQLKDNVNCHSETMVTFQKVLELLTTSTYTDMLKDVIMNTKFVNSITHSVKNKYNGFRESFQAFKDKLQSIKLKCRPIYSRLRTIEERISDIEISPKFELPQENPSLLKNVKKYLRSPRGYSTLSKGGNKQTLYKSTKITHTCKDGKRYKVYEKDGRYYIRKYNKNNELRYYCVKV
jgi:hypothetical protein